MDQSDKAAQVKAVQEQILNLLAPGEKMTAVRISMRLEERTGGSGELSDSVVTGHLEVLVSEGRLSLSITQKIIEGNSMKVTEYFLPLEEGDTDVQIDFP